MGKTMKSILAGNYVSDTNNIIKTPWGLTSDNSKIEYKMIDLNSPETVSNAYVEKQEENWAENHIYTYTISDIYWIDKWCKNIIKVTDSLAYKCRDAGKEIFKLTDKHPEATSNLPIVSVYVFFSLKELKEIRNYASMYYSSNVKTVEAKNTLYDINLRIKYLEKQSEKMKNKSELENNACDRSLHPITPAERISCKCDYIACNICNNEKELAWIIKECIKEKYDVVYKYSDISTTEGYFVSGEMVSNLANDETKLIIKFHDTRDDGDYDIDTNILNLKTIKFENNTLYIQARND